MVVAALAGAMGGAKLLIRGDIQLDQGSPVFRRDAVALSPSLRRVGRDFDANGLQVGGEFRGAVVLDDGFMTAHGVFDSTKRATFKHKLSFDPWVRHWQLRRMGIGARIKAAREIRGWSQAELGRRVGAVQTTVSSWERERTEPSREDVQRIADAMEISPAELEMVAGIAGEARRTVPLVGYVGAGAEAHFYASADEGLGEVEAPPGSTDLTRAAEIRGESLGPLFEHWLVFYDDVRAPVTSDLIGKLCIVGLPNDKVLVKKIQRSRTAGLYHLLSNNEAPMLDQEVIWAARVKTMTPR